MLQKLLNLLSCIDFISLASAGILADITLWLIFYTVKMYIETQSLFLCFLALPIIFFGVVTTVEVSKDILN